MLSRLMGWRFLEVALLSISRYFFTGNRDITMITSKATMTMLKMNVLKPLMRGKSSEIRSLSSSDILWLDNFFSNSLDANVM